MRGSLRYSGVTMISFEMITHVHTSRMSHWEMDCCQSKDAPCSLQVFLMISQWSAHWKTLRWVDLEIQNAIKEVFVWGLVVLFESKNQTDCGVMDLKNLSGITTSQSTLLSRSNEKYDHMVKHRCSPNRDLMTAYGQNNMDFKDIKSNVLNWAHGQLAQMLMLMALSLPGQSFVLSLTIYSWLTWVASCKDL